MRDSSGKRVRVSYGQWLGQPPSQIEPVYLEYLAKDVIATRQLYIQLRRRLRRLKKRSGATWGYVSHEWLDSQSRRLGPQTHHVQLRAAVALAEVSERGLHIDPQRRRDLASALEVERDSRKADLATHGYLPGKGSAKALQAILSRIERNRPGRPLPRTPKGKYSAKAADLRDLAAEVPFVDVFLKFHSVQKLLVSFMNKLAKPTVHPSFRTLTRSGRTSSFGEINAQTLPRDGRVRDCFIPKQGYTFVTADYSTIELATLAQACTSQFCLDSQMAAAIRAGRDLHTMVAAHVTSKPVSEVTADERRKAKPINFGRPGGMGLTTLRATAKSSYGLDLSLGASKPATDGRFKTSQG